MPPHLLLQYGESRNESENAPVPYVTFGYRSDHEHLHAPRAGRCQRRDDTHGGIERCQEGTGKDHRREAYDPEDVPGGVTIKNGKGALRCRAFFLWRIIDEYGTMVTGLLCLLHNLMVEVALFQRYIGGSII